MSKQEFLFCWNNWIKKIVRPISALIVVDVQNDFISGSLAISNCPAGHDGEEVRRRVEEEVLRGNKGRGTKVIKAWKTKFCGVQHAKSS